MKASYETALKSLVTAGTITQDQSDKVLEADTINEKIRGNMTNPKSNQSNE